MTTIDALQHSHVSQFDPSDTIPELQGGDILDVDEFERRYQAMPPDTKAELIEGRVYIVAPPVSIEGHAVPQFGLGAILGHYMILTPGVRGADNATIRIAPRNMPQPDFFLFIDPSHGGRATFNNKGYLEVGPEFVAEVANTSASYDLHDKFSMYEKLGVNEYLVWRTFDASVDFFRLINGKFIRQEADEAGIHRSDGLPGLWINAKSFAKRDFAAALATVQAGIASDAHTQFVSSLQSKFQPKA